MSSKLPPAARAKLYGIAQSADDADALASAALASVKAGEAKLARVLSAIENAGSDARSEELKADARALGVELESLRTTQGERLARRNAARTLVTSISEWVDRLPPNVSLAPVRTAHLTENGEGARASVERHRKKIGELRAEIDATRKAPLARDEVRHFVRAWVRQHADRGRPRIQVSDERADVLFENTRALVSGDPPPPAAGRGPGSSTGEKTTGKMSALASLGGQHAQAA